MMLGNHHLTNHNIKMTKTASRRKKDKATFDPVVAAPILNTILVEIETAKANHDSKTVPYGFIATLIEKKKPMIPWLTKDRIYNHMKKLKKELNKTKSCYDTDELPTLSISTPVTWSSMSTLTNSVNSNNNNQTMSPAIIMESAATSNESEQIGDLSDISNEELTERTYVVGSDMNGENGNNGETSTVTTTAKSHGRPKGSTAAAKLDMANQIALTWKEAAEQFFAVMQVAKQRKLKRVNQVITPLVHIRLPPLPNTILPPAVLPPTLE